MSEILRHYRYKGLNTRRDAMTAADIEAELEISPATFKRVSAKLRDHLHVPIIFVRDLRGYRMAQRPMMLSDRCQRLVWADAEHSLPKPKVAILASSA